MSVGRPTKYKPEMCQEVVKFMAQGYSKEATAAFLDISVDTFFRWQKENEEFSEAIKEGSAKSLLFWEKLGIAGALGKVDGFNASSWIFNMKNRHKWTDRIDNKTELAGSVEVTKVERIIVDLKDTDS